MADEMYQNNVGVQQAVTAALDEQKKKKKKKRLIIFAVIAALIIVVIAFGSGGSENSGSETGGTNAAGGEQQVSEAPKAVDGKLGDYVCTVKTAIKCKNWEGKDAVKIVYNFTNNSSNPMSFDTALEDKVFQEGIALETTFTSADEGEIWDVEIKPGVTKEVTKIYQLRNSTSDLEIEVGEWLSFDDTKYTTTIKF